VQIVDGQLSDAAMYDPLQHASPVAVA
jgi:hypothetical protein